MSRTPALNGSSSSSSLRCHSEYVTAFELEAWKAEETQRFREHLQQEESKYRVKWELECQSLESDRSSQFAAKLKQLQTLETRLRTKLGELEQRELKLSQTETEVAQKLGGFQSQIKRMQEEHSLALKSQTSAHAAEISVFSEKLRLCEVRSVALDRKFLDSENLELKQKTTEIASLTTQLTALAKSRDHFRRALLQTLQSPQSCGLAGLLETERASLLRDGMCAADDPLIRALDEEIALANSNR